MWLTPDCRGKLHVGYFRNNTESGIRTFQDDEITEQLRALGYTY